MEEKQATTTPGFVREWVDAWSAHDGARLALLYAEDGLYEDVPSGYNARGADIEGFVGGFADLVGDLTWELGGASATGDRASAEWTFSGKNSGLVPGEDAAGKRISVRGSTTFELDGDGRIRRSSDYYDFATIMRQVGALPEG